jgi:hypothetical protein
MTALKEPQRITLVEALTILQRHLSTEQAKLRLRQAFIQKAFRQEPIFALPYGEADIDWMTGSVKIPRMRDRFYPTFLTSDFNAYFFEDHTAAAPLTIAKSAEKPAELITLKPQFMGMSIDLKELGRRSLRWVALRRRPGHGTGWF